QRKKGDAESRHANPPQSSSFIFVRARREIRRRLARPSGARMNAPRLVDHNTRGPRRLTHVGDSLAVDFLTPWRGRIRVMPAAVRLREDYSAETLRGLGRRSKNVNQSRRLPSVGTVLSGMDRGGAAEIGEHGPTDAAGLDPSLQRFGAGGSV